MATILDSDGGTDAGPLMTPTDAEIERILAMTDEEILALSADPGAEAAMARAAFERAFREAFPAPPVT